MQVFSSEVRYVSAQNSPEKVDKKAVAKGGDGEEARERKAA